MMPTLNGVLETSLYVEALERAAGFYERLFGCERLVEDDRICVLNIAGKQALLLFLRGASDRPMPMPGGGFIPGHDGSGSQHVAFSIPVEELPAWERRLSELGVPLETKVTWPSGGQSLYFRDPDGHSIELAARVWPGVDA